MKKKPAIALMSSFFVVFFAMLATASYFNGPVKLNSLQEAKSKLEAGGFFCVCDNPSGLTNGGFMVSKKPMDYKDVVSLAGDRARGKLPDGVAWLEIIKHSSHDIVPHSNSRMLGRVSVQGDSRFIDVIESALR